jgi:hypothetical protein
MVIYTGEKGYKNFEDLFKREAFKHFLQSSSFEKHEKETILKMIDSSDESSRNLAYDLILIKLNERNI